MVKQCQTIIAPKSSIALWTVDNHHPTKSLRLAGAFTLQAFLGVHLHALAVSLLDGGEDAEVDPVF